MKFPYLYHVLVAMALVGNAMASQEEKQTTTSTKQSKIASDEFSRTKQRAEQGDPRAQYDVGVMYAQGRRVPQNYGEAAKWFKLAAKQGHANAQNNLCLMYSSGEGVPQNRVIAYALCNLGAATGDENAINGRNNLLKEMTQTEIAEGQRISAQWVSDAKIVIP